MTDDDDRDFKQAKECHICEEKYGEKDIRVRDHCHITGKYRISAHQDCNLKLRINPKEIKILVIFHNLRGYDSHFIMQEIGDIALRNRACRYASLVNANFSVNQMCPIICRWKLVKHRYCFGDNRRTKDNRKIKLCGLKACCVT